MQKYYGCPSTWTGSLPRDTEAVEISPLSIVPGIMWLRPGHVELVKNIRSSGVVDLIGSTVPAAVRRLITVTDLGYIPDKATLGFRKWSWPALLTDSAPAALDPAAALVRARPAAVPHTAKPEITAKPDFLNSAQRVFQFEASVRSSLGSRTEFLSETISRVAADFCTLLHARAEVVELSELRRLQTQRCMNSRDYDAYSTPSRDLRVRRAALQLGLLMNNNLSAVEAGLAQCTSLTLNGGIQLAPFAFLKRLLKFEYSSDPNENVLARFGFEPPAGSCSETGIPAELSAPQSAAN